MNSSVSTYSRPERAASVLFFPAIFIMLEPAIANSRIAISQRQEWRVVGEKTFTPELFGGVARIVVKLDADRVIRGRFFCFR